MEEVFFLVCQRYDVIIFLFELGKMGIISQRMICDRVSGGKENMHFKTTNKTGTVIII